MDQQRTVSRPPAVTQVVPDRDGVRLEEEQAVGSGLPLEDDLERLARAVSERGATDLLGWEMPEERRERVLRMFDVMAAASSQLTDELCKEDHGRFMKLAAQIEELASRVEAQLIALKRDVEGQAVMHPGLVMALIAIFSPRYRKIVSHMESQRIQRGLTLQAIKEYRELSERIRKRPADIHEKAVQHQKRLLLQDEVRYQQLNDIIAQAAHDVEDANRKGHWDRVEQFKVNLRTLKEQLPRIEQEAYDRALQMIQESDNGPRP